LYFLITGAEFQIVRIAADDVTGDRATVEALRKRLSPQTGRP